MSATAWPRRPSSAIGCMSSPAATGTKSPLPRRRIGNELWADKYKAKPASGPASQFPGPRSSPTVADGKVVTLGVHGTLSCLDAATGKVSGARPDADEASPRFFTSCSPIVVDGLCIVQFGGEEKGGIAAYDLTSGNEKWKWTGDGTAYASPDLLTIDGVKMLVALTANNLVGLGVADGKLAWKTPFAVKGMGYNAATPIVGGQTIYIAGSFRGTQALKIEKQGDPFTGQTTLDGRPRHVDAVRHAGPQERPVLRHFEPQFSYSA